jgi:hypothetical protein
MFKCEYAHRIAACDGLGWIIPFLSLADARGTATTVLSLILSVVLVLKLSTPGAELGLRRVLHIVSFGTEIKIVNLRRYLMR